MTISSQITLDTVPGYAGPSLSYYRCHYTGFPFFIRFLVLLLTMMMLMPAIVLDLLPLLLLIIIIIINLDLATAIKIGNDIDLGNVNKLGNNGGIMPGMMPRTHLGGGPGRQDKIPGTDCRRGGGWGLRSRAGVFSDNLNHTGWVLIVVRQYDQLSADELQLRLKRYG